MTRLWKDITGYEGVYMISNDGLVRSLFREWVCNGSVIKKPERVLKNGIDAYGYNTVMLSCGNKTKRVKVHRLVAQEFLDNKNNLPQINHKNGVKTDNRVENLEWVTAKDNCHHAREHGFINDNGENSKMSVLNTQDVLYIIKEYKYGNKSQAELSRLFSVNAMTINNIINGESWKHITNGVKTEPINRKDEVVLNIETGVFYNSIREAAASINYNYSNMVAALRGIIRNRTSFIIT